MQDRRTDDPRMARGRVADADLLRQELCRAILDIGQRRRRAEQGRQHAGIIGAAEFLVDECSRRLRVELADQPLEGEPTAVREDLDRVAGRADTGRVAPS